MPTKRQLGLLHVAKKRIGIDDDDWRALLRRVAGVESSADLDRVGFEALMDALANLGFKSDFRQKNLGGRPGWATAGQVAIIRRLWGDVTDGEGDDAGLDKWIAKQFKVSSLRWVDQPTARKVIAALKSWQSRKSARTLRRAAG